MTQRTVGRVEERLTKSAGSALELDAAAAPVWRKFGRYVTNPQPVDHAADQGKVQTADQVGVIGGQAVERTVGQLDSAA